MEQTLGTAVTSLDIHILDDDPEDVLLLKSALHAIQNADVRATHTLTLRATLEQLQLEEPDLILIDYRLGARNGIEAMRRIRGAGHTMPMILTTGQGGEEIAVEAFRAGASDYVIKSGITPEGLSRAVRNALEKHHLREALGDKTRRLESSNSELTRKNEQISSFYHTLSHELKTPLTSLREFLSILADGIAGPVNDQQLEYLCIARESCDLLKVYIDDILDVTRLETGKMSLALRDEDLVEITRTAVKAMRPSARRKGIRLVFAGEVPSLRLDCDRARVTQILDNLIGNAVKFTSEGGTVEVGVSETDDATAARIRVSDTGRGIEPEHQKHVFEQLYQVRGSDAGSAEGLGLGLGLCRQLAHLHGGRIELESEFGAGSTFCVTLPRNADAGGTTG